MLQMSNVWPQGPILQPHSKMCEMWRKPKEDPPKCANCHEQHPSNFAGCEARVKYTQRTQPTSNKQSTVNKQYVPRLTENNLPDLPQHTSNFNWRNPRKPYVPTQNSRNINQLRQLPPQTNQHYDGNSISELIKEITSLFQGFNIKHLIQKLTATAHSLRSDMSMFDKVAIILEFIISCTSNENTQENTNTHSAAPPL
jgi:hypothetical protein